MVMEAATLSSPHRKFSVVPVQKSLSLPSYARAGGGGIDHRLIFAALEQKEKGRRRKSGIFTREKKNTRQNIFCLPIPSSRHDKCRETSFSSDTSCSSLEYQKPKKAEPKTKTTPNLTESDKTTIRNESARRTTTQDESSISILQPTESKLDEVALGRITQSEIKSSPVEVERTSVDYIARLNVCSSDSMERSSRSSTDSFSRKERLVAMKARVEAAREKYGYSSSEEESRPTMTRYNSDGSIHRSLREVKSRSSRSEKRLRRRSQGEWSNQSTYGKINRKKNINLSLNAEDGIQLNLESNSTAYNDIDQLDIKTDFCPSPNFPDLIKKNYFSDFPCRENSARFVQARIQYIEDEERKRRSGSDFREIKTPRHSPQSFENTSPASTERKYPFGRQNGSTSCFIEKNSCVDISCCSPLPKSTQAPTPPPRSPKSLTFMNKAFIQHQNASLRKKEICVDQSKYSQPNTSSHTKVLDQFNSKRETLCNEAKYLAESVNNPSEKQKFRELITNRRKTCGNFDFIDKNILDDLCSIKGSVDSSSSIMAANKKFSSVMQIRGTESKGYFSSSETPCAPSEENLRGKLWKTKWQEADQKREYMFNSLESKKSNPPSWRKMGNPIKNTCICRLFPEEKFMCICKNEQKERSISSDIPSIKKEMCNPLLVKNTSSVRITSDRLSKSEVNISFKEKNRSSSPVVSANVLSNTAENTQTVIDNFKNCYSDKISASANLESAMEELESVYRSLKISSDNLSDRNSVSNASLSDDGVKAPVNSNCPSEDYSDFKRKTSVCVGNSKAEFYTSFDSCNLGKGAFIKYNNISPPIYPTSLSINKATDTNQLSIDELFNNMTLQLDDLEKNIGKDGIVHASRQPECNNESNRLDNSLCINNSSSQISIRKQFFDNLCKSNQTENKNNIPSVQSNDIRSTNPCLNKKKHKAIRSLSHNLSYLMASTDSIKDKNGTPFDEMNYYTPHAARLVQNSPTFNERTHFDESLVTSKTDIALKRPSIFNNTNKNTALIPKREEICHIRVSMDSDFNQLKPIASDSHQEFRKYPRLSSAVSSSQIPSSKCEVSKEIPVQDVIPHSNSLKKSGQYHPLRSDLSSSQAPSSKCEVSMVIPIQDVIPLSNSLQGSRQYPRSSSAMSSSLVSSSKTDVSLENSVQGAMPSNSNLSKDSVDVDGLEKLLNSLLGEVPERQQSSLLLDSTTPPPVSTGKVEDVKSNRKAFPLKMDVYVTSKQKKNTSAEYSLKNVKPEENAQKVNDSGQNNNASVGQMSFIPVYTKKTNLCQNFSSSTKDEKSKRVDSPEPTKSLSYVHSPPPRHKVLPEQNEKAHVKTWSMHMRRRSVGFEDMTSVASRYGYNLTNDQRMQTCYVNCNVEAGSAILPRNNTNSENNRSLTTKSKTESENGCISRINQNTQLSENENNHSARADKPSQYLKDKSSKRKSSLNRIDFVDFPTSAESIQLEKTSQRNSSSDEGSDCKSHHTKPEFLSTSSKRKHNISSSISSLPKATDRKINELSQTNSSTGKGRSCLLPRSLQKNQMKLRQHRRVHSAASHLQKFSHSAGELESLTDPSETASASHKICLSAQEFDTNETPHKNSKTTKRHSCIHLPAKSPYNASYSGRKNNDCSNYSPPFSCNKTLCNSVDFTPNPHTKKESSLECGPTAEEPIAPEKSSHHCSNPEDPDSFLDLNRTLDLNGALDLKHIDSRSEEDSELAQSMSKMDNLDISLDDDICSEDNAELSGSEAERCSGSILRKKSSEEKRELHGILKMPSEDNPSWTPPSILKHRESSEEKEMWLQGDLHSILKKSTSEEESCNSGSDIIRPILKVSTDEDSSGGGCNSSNKPRPILKKRTSFSEECFYTSYSNGELKPILKKKITALAFDEQPRPILKSRRKSEDTKSFSEFVASRPRAYSADMGIKPTNHETRLEGLELNQEDPSKCRDDHNL